MNAVGNTVRALGDAPREITVRHAGFGLQAAPAYGEGVSKALWLPLSDIQQQGSGGAAMGTGNPLRVRKGADAKLRIAEVQCLSFR